ncbi:hypothetical protein XCR_1020 [Xanthomonas campestris pv. raphani 756C]|nr:hypothetical protein XCR_1020 [Xanthomonas campestris pv. raphani 756C]
MCETSADHYRGWQQVRTPEPVSHFDSRSLSMQFHQSI